MSETKDVTPSTELNEQQKTWNEYMVASAKVGQLYYSAEEIRIQLNNALVDQRNAVEKHNRLVKSMQEAAKEVKQ